MASERRASERARARASLGPSARRGRAPASGHARARGSAGLIVALAFVSCALAGACRQTVVLDPSARGSGGSGGSGGGGPLLDGGSDPDKNGPGGGQNGGMNGGGGGSRSDGGRPDGSSPFCQGGQIQIVPITMRTPDIIVSVDRSSGMQSWFGSGTRLQVIQQQVHALVAKYRVVKFGYEEFPDVTGACGNGQGCCAGDVALPSYNNLKVIERVFHLCDNGGVGCDQPQRPIADALAKCLDTFTNTVFSMNDTGHRYVVLLTSGDPTCSSPDAPGTLCDSARAQVTLLSRAFINTAVFGVGDDAAGSACLDLLALYGGLESTGASPLYHLAKTPSALASQLDSLVETIAEEACKIDVRSPPADMSKAQLLFDGVPVPTDGVDGWTFDQDTSVTLTVHGSYCSKLTQMGVRVDLITGCPSSHN